MQLSKSLEQLIRSLQQAKYRNQHHLFAAEGLKTVQDLVKYGYNIRYLITTHEAENLNFHLSSQVEKYKVSRETMDRISALTTPPGILAVFQLPVIKNSLFPPNNEWSLILDGIKDPGNMGTLIRTAHWFGIKKLYLANHCVDVFSPKTVQSSMGSLGAVQIEKIEDIKSWTIHALNSNYPLYATSLSGKPLLQFKPNQPGGIIMGSESHGIDPLWSNYVSQHLLIPTLSNNPPDSLNVAVSAGIILHYLLNSDIR
ncbi:MAG: RNA methyltransferase [Flavobacteriales bacterium]|nr:RNA methyltransferase [Flavobacteriales bacterium]